MLHSLIVLFVYGNLEANVSINQGTNVDLAVFVRLITKGMLTVFYN